MIAHGYTVIPFQNHNFHSPYPHSHSLLATLQERQEQRPRKRKAKDDGWRPMTQQELLADAARTEVREWLIGAVKEMGHLEAGSKLKKWDFVFLAI